MDLRKARRKVKVVKTPIFIPYTKDSLFKKTLTEADEAIGEAIGSPAIRFVERNGGGTLIVFWLALAKRK